jgi:hypothetical protein
VLKSHSTTLGSLAAEVDAFLASDLPAMRRIQRSVLYQLAKLGKVYVIGGLVRDLAIYGPDSRPISDIDLVVRCRPSALSEFAKQIGALPNRFGGFGIRTDAFKVDFWAFANTWAKTAGHVPLRQPKDLTRTTFFDWDAVVYGLEENKVWAIDRYFERLNSGVLGLNLEPNPSPKGSLIRALRRIMAWDARPAAGLRHFVEQKLSEYDWSDILRTESEAFSTAYLQEFGTADQYLEFVLRRSKFENVGSHQRRQVTFAEFAKLPTQAYFKRIPRTLTFSQASVRKRRKRVKAADKDLFD